MSYENDDRCEDILITNVIVLNYKIYNLYHNIEKSFTYEANLIV